MTNLPFPVTKEFSQMRPGIEGMLPIYRDHLGKNPLDNHPKPQIPSECTPGDGVLRQAKRSRLKSHRQWVGVTYTLN